MTGGPPPIVVVTGTDRAAVVDAFHTERDRLEADLDIPAGAEEFEGDDSETVARAIDAASTPSMFGGQRLVVLRDGVAEETLGVLAAYAQAPADDCVLLVLHVRLGRGRASKAWKSFTARAKEIGKLVQVAAPPERRGDLSAYMQEAASARGLRLSREATNHLVAHVGPDAGAIARVMDQLAAACPDGQVESKVTEALVTGPVTAKTWDLTDAIDAGDTGGALRKLHALLYEMHPLQLEATLVNHVRKLTAAVELRPRSPKELEQALGIKAYPAKKIYGRVRDLDRRRLDTAHTALVEADQDLRGRSGLEMHTLLDVLVTRLCRLLGPSRQGSGRARAEVRKTGQR